MFKLEELLQATKAKLIRKSKSNLITGVSTDSRTLKKGGAFFALIGENFNGHDFVKDAVEKGAGVIVISDEKNDSVKGLINSNVQVTILKVKDTTIALGDLARHHRKSNNMPLIAITGSVGKTTAKDIITQVLSKNFCVLKNIGTQNNQIGVPQTIFNLNPKHDICIMELGTNHFGEISYLSGIVQPQIAVITSIGASHLEFFNSLEGVFKEKKEIVNNLQNPRIVLLNGDDALLRKIKLPSKFKIFYFGQIKENDFMVTDITIKDNKVNFLFNKRHNFSINTLGKFNIYNALAGIACGLIFGITIKDIKEALCNFQFPEKRLNMVECSGFSIIDDTYNSNPLSLKNAIDSLVDFKAKGRRILVMGDMLELGRQSEELHKQIGILVSQKPIDIFVTFGKLSQSAADAAKTISKSKQGIFKFNSKIELIDFLKTKIKPRDVVLIKGSRRLKMEDVVSSLRNIK